MTPLLTVNLLRVLFVTFCGAIGGIVTVETQGNPVPGILVAVVFALIIVLADRLLKERADLKVIYTSGYSIEMLDRPFGSRKDVNFLTKPYHPLKLAQTVRSCLDS